jgi:hypothetical protein
LCEVLGLLRVSHDEREPPDQSRLVKPKGLIERRGTGAEGLHPYHVVAVM